MKPRDSIALATDPFGVVRHASWKSTIKERLAKISNVNHDGAPPSDPEATQLLADLPRNFKIKFRPDQFGFLKLNLFEIAVKIHFFEEILRERVWQSNCRNGRPAKSNQQSVISESVISPDFRFLNTDY
jgi:hypothetical protein